MQGFRHWFSEAKTGFEEWWSEGHFQGFIRDLWKSRWYLFFVAAAIGLVSICSPSTSEQPVVEQQPLTQVVTSPEVEQIREHVVRRGEFLIAIAKSYRVPWEAVMLLNEHELQARAEKRCGKLSERYTERKRGYYCNTTRTFRGQSVVHANSLQPKDVIRIPPVASPREIEQVIQNVSGNRIVIVIDDTGSMNDDRQRVGAWYASAIQKSGKIIVRVILYADGSIREYDTGEVRFFTQGTMENTFAALERAASYRPDTIVLISDEPGDDWPHSFGRLPPIIAHSLDPSADRSLEAVARRTGGQFVQMHGNGQFAVVP